MFKVKVKGHVIRTLLYWHENHFLRISLGYVELFIIRIKFAIYYFLHFNTVRQVASRLRAKSAIYDCLVYLYDTGEPVRADVPGQQQ